MAASGGHGLQHQKGLVDAQIPKVKNDDLKNICRANGHIVSGTKPALVERCKGILNDIVSRGDVVAFEAFKRTAGISSYQIPSLLGPNASHPPPNAYSSTASPPYNMAPNRGAGAGLNQNRLPANSRVFKSSPFHEVLQTLLPLQDLPDGPEMPQNRHTVKSTIAIKPDVAQQFRSGDGSTLKVLLYCGLTNSMSAYTQVDVAFPNQIEVKVNDQDVKHNFKGLKNKAGSTKPADITSFLRKFGGQDNTIQITYALTNKRFAFAAFLVQSVSADKLVERIKKGNIIAKDRVLHDMNKANADPDIAATSIRMSLKDPVSTMRITIPVRSSHCTHNQCFDGVMFLQLQEQAPQWSCPVCSKHVSFDSLCVDKYFEDILNRTSRSIDKVDIEPNGDWKVIKEEEDVQPNGTSSKARASYDDDFDDLVELDQPAANKPLNGVKKDTYPLTLSPFPGQGSMFGTPPLSSREPSVPQSTTSAPRSGSKRPQSSVIDLTLSDDDEDDDPPRPAKRQSTYNVQRSQPSNAPAAPANSYNTPNSIPDSRYQPQQQQQRTHSQSSNTHHLNNYRPANTSTNNVNSNFNNFGSTNNTNSYNSYNTHFSTSISPANPVSPFGQPAVPAPHTRPPNSSHQNHPYQPYSTYSPAPPSSPFATNTNFAMRPASTSNSNSGSHSGLRLPPMQTHMPSMSSAHQQQQARSTPDSSNDGLGLFNGWRSDWDYGNYGSSSPG